MARAMRRDARSSPSSNSRSASSRSGSGVDQVGGGRAGAVHAHVQRPVAAEREAARRIVELERGHAEIQHHAIQRGRRRAPPAGPACRRTGHGSGAAGRESGRPGSAPRAIASGSRSIAHSVQGAASQDRRRIAAAAERAVEIDAAIARGRADASTSASMTGTWAGMGLAHRAALRRQGEAADARALARLGAAAFGRRRLPDLEDAAQAHEHHGVGQAGIGDQESPAARRGPPCRPRPERHRRTVPRPGRRAPG